MAPRPSSGGVAAEECAVLSNMSGEKKKPPSWKRLTIIARSASGGTKKLAFYELTRFQTRIILGETCLNCDSVAVYWLALTQVVSSRAMNLEASKLGRRAKGKPKTLTKAERKRRSQRLAEARLKRWSGSWITLHPAISELVNAQVSRINNVPRTKMQDALNSRPVTPDSFVNEILWMALRSGDVGKHYTSL